MSEENTQLQNIIEGAILAAGEALSIDRILSLFDENEQPEKDDIKQALLAIQEKNAGRGFELVEVASGWRFQVVEDIAMWVNRLWDEKPQKYSRALLETLALVAYRQPITRGDIEDVRGVAVSSHIIKTLVEREWVKVVGHRDVPGRPALYATTRQFLDYFNLKSLDELPTLGELKDIDGLNEDLAFEEAVEASKTEDLAESDAQEQAADEAQQAAAGAAPVAENAEATAETAAETDAADEAAVESETLGDDSLVDELAEADTDSDIENETETDSSETSELEQDQEQVASSAAEEHDGAEETEQVDDADTDLAASDDINEDETLAEQDLNTSEEADAPASELDESQTLEETSEEKLD
ncbi:SMC-Scp complex subunit ScpB [Saccharophagus degradans]|uniref:SMC-Scp complex subunit ScpB n=1 Tax=Saccharophagus degradans TaxID=86304 RepID=A0AAW7X943_9GAMM|nr:SMC-Scp complex subunit ScpB [Saccharophagus degradans]MDO6424203.1 SMC-Scp complex subunit ScpB [Saccharophagus degradans]MDO6608250.1 SMC-Scp complex subunit ScpB [Saccharophagus degradans]